jgi:hypothetical protein
LLPNTFLPSITAPSHSGIEVLSKRIGVVYPGDLLPALDVQSNGDGQRRILIDAAYIRDVKDEGSAGVQGWCTICGNEEPEPTQFMILESAAGEPAEPKSRARRGSVSQFLRMVGGGGADEGGAKEEPDKPSGGEAEEGAAAPKQSASARARRSSLSDAYNRARGKDEAGIVAQAKVILFKIGGDTQDWVARGACTVFLAEPNESAPEEYRMVR